MKVDKGMKMYLKRFICLALTVVMVCGLVPIAKVEAEAYYSVSRDDGVWLFPLDSSYYSQFSDWAGCPGAGACPFCGYVHSGWTDPDHTGQPAGHNGIDVGAGSGVSVYAPANGVVVGAAYRDSRGYTVMIKHDLGNSWAYYSYSQHLNSMSVSVNQTITAGTIIGTVGGTGGYDPHLHFGIIMAPSSYTFDQVLNVDYNSGSTWLTTSGYATGRILTNPKNGYGYAGLYNAGAAVDYHRGSVTYTFDKNSVSLPSSVSTTAISLAPDRKTIDIGESATLTATVSPSNATNKTVTWTSSDTSVVTVSGGTIKGVKAGVATITATASGGQTATCKVVVFPSTATPTAITEYNGHLYELYDYTSSWKDAQEFCEARGGHLVTITTEEENDVVYNLAQNGNKARYCLGASDEVTESSWVWETGEDFSYRNFQSGEDTDSTEYEEEDYLFMYTNNGQWGDVRNYAYDPTVNGFICEYESLLTYDNVTVIGNKVYELYEREYPITVATGIAESRGGHLVSLTSEEEQTALIAWIQANSDILYISLGANDLTTEGTWEWSSGEDWSYTSWVDGEPNDTNGIEDNAVLILSSGKWNDVTGAYAYSFVVEYDLEKWLDAGNDANDIIFNELPEGADPDDYEIVTEYRYRDKQTTTSTASSMSGWTLYDSEVSYGSWGSAQTTNTKPTENETLQITGTTTKYKYYHYWNYYDGYDCIDSISYGTNKGYCEILLTYQLSAVSMADQGGQQAYGSYTCGNEGFNYWFYGGTVTTYSYQTRSKTTTNYFYKYGDWSDWSTTPVTSTDDREIETRTIYVLKDHNHTYSDWVVETEVTCITDGLKSRICSDCGDVETEVITATGHDYSTVWTIDKKATCTEKGSKSHHCLNCNSKTDVTVISATGHSVGSWITDKKPTVNAAGSKHKECTECGEVLETAKIKQLKCSKPKLKTIANTSSGVKITWGKVSGADTYRVYRKTKSGSWKYLGSTSKTGYTDKTAKSGTKYYYAVRARNEAGNSSLSSSLSKLYLADPTLKTPTSTKSGVSLKWTKTTGAQGYIIYRKTGSGSYQKLKTEKGVSNLSYVDKSAKKGKKYTYKVKAYYSKT